MFFYIIPITCGPRSPHLSVFKSCPWKNDPPLTSTTTLRVLSSLICVCLTCPSEGCGSATFTCLCTHEHLTQVVLPDPRCCGCRSSYVSSRSCPYVAPRFSAVEFRPVLFLSYSNCHSCTSLTVPARFAVPSVTTPGGRPFRPRKTRSFTCHCVTTKLPVQVSETVRKTYTPTVLPTSQ